MSPPTGERGGGLIAGAGRWIDRLRINRVVRVCRADGVWWAKERLPAAAVLIPVANLFFRWAGNPVAVIRRMAEWHRWESGNFRALHGPEFRVAGDGATVYVEEVPGVDLSRLLARGALRAPPLAAAGAELRRAHGLDADYFGGPWSHGDPHLANFVFDPATGRARLLDFEVRHHRALPSVARQTDDLLVFLQDLIGRCERTAWVPLAMAFLTGYGGGEPPVRLRERLALPGGCARLWWAVRTTYLPTAELRGRLRELREFLGRGPGRAGTPNPRGGRGGISLAE